MSINIKPRGDMVAVVQGHSENKTQSGIVIPGGKKPEYATVVAVGPGLHTTDGTLVPLDLNVGDRVVVWDNGPTQTIGDGPTAVELYHSHQILAVISVEDPAADQAPAQDEASA